MAAFDPKRTLSRPHPSDLAIYSTLFFPRQNVRVGRARVWIEMTRFSVWTLSFAVIAAAVSASCSPQSNLSSDAANGDLAAVQRDLASKIDPNTTVGGDPVLFAAVRGGHLEVVQALLKAGADVNAKDEALGYTALMTAAGMHNDLIKPLVAAGADLEARGKAGQTALMNAVTLDDPDTVQALIDAGADVNEAYTTTPGSPPILAVFKDNPKFDAVTRVLIRNGAHA